MDYYYFIKDAHNFIHSIDNLCVSYFLKCSLQYALVFLHDLGSGREAYYENLNKKACSKYQFYQNSIHFDDGIYLRLGKYTMYIKEQKNFELLPVMQIDINPNKHFQKDSFKQILAFIHEYCSDGHLEKYDYAIDIEKPLSDIQIFGSRKEKGLYKGTRYYGQRNKHGYCKIYDKQKEQKLDNVLSRVEHTLSGEKLPSLESFYLREVDASCDLDELPASLRCTVELCLEIKKLGGDYESIISKLGRTTLWKISKYLSGGYKEYEYDLSIINRLLEFCSKDFWFGYSDANGFMHITDEELPFD